MTCRVCVYTLLLLTEAFAIPTAKVSPDSTEAAPLSLYRRTPVLSAAEAWKSAKKKASAARKNVLPTKAEKEEKWAAEQADILKNWPKSEEVIRLERQRDEKLAREKEKEEGKRKEKEEKQASADAPYSRANKRGKSAADALDLSQEEGISRHEELEHLQDYHRHKAEEARHNAKGHEANKDLAEENNEHEKAKEFGKKAMQANVDYHHHKYKEEHIKYQRLENEGYGRREVLEQKALAFQHKEDKHKAKAKLTKDHGEGTQRENDRKEEDQKEKAASARLEKNYWYEQAHRGHPDSKHTGHIDEHYYPPQHAIQVAPANHWSGHAQNQPAQIGYWPHTQPVHNQALVPQSYHNQPNPYHGSNHVPLGPSRHMTAHYDAYGRVTHWYHRHR